MSDERQSSQTGPDPIALCGILIAIGLVGWWTQNQRRITGWYVNHYEEIYLALWGVVLLMVGLAMLYVRKKTKAIKERGELLSPLWEQKGNNILAGNTSDGIDLHLSDDLRCTHVQ